MRGTRVKQINNIIITKEGKNYYAWSPDGSKCLATKTVLSEMEKLCKNCNTFIQNKAVGVPFKVIAQHFISELDMCIGLVEKPTPLQSRIENNGTLLRIRESITKNVWFDYIVKLSYDTKNEIINLVLGYIDSNRFVNLTNTKRITKPEASNVTFIRKLGAEIIHALRTSLTPAKVYYYGNITGCNLPNVINSKFYGGGALAHGMAENYARSHEDCFGRYYVYANIHGKGDRGFLLAFDMENNKIICDVYEFRTGDTLRPSDFLFKVNVDTHNMPRFIQSMGNKLNKLAYEAFISGSEEIEDI